MKHRPKGKRTAKKKSTDFSLYSKYTKGLSVALAYGFTFITTPKITDEDTRAAKGIKESKLPGEERLFVPHPEEKQSLSRQRSPY